MISGSICGRLESAICRRNIASLSSCIGTIHQCNFPSNLTPLKLTLNTSTVSGLMSEKLEHFLPFEEFIRKSEVWLYDDIQSTSANEAVRTWKREIQRSHHLCNADCSTARNANTAVDKSCCAFLPAALCTSVRPCPATRSNKYEMHRGGRY